MRRRDIYDTGLRWNDKRQAGTWVLREFHKHHLVATLFRRQQLHRHYHGILAPAFGRVVIRALADFVEAERVV